MNNPCSDIARLFPLWNSPVCYLRIITTIHTPSPYVYVKVDLVVGQEEVGLDLDSVETGAERDRAVEDNILRRLAEVELLEDFDRVAFGDDAGHGDGVFSFCRVQIDKYLKNVKSVKSCCVY